MIPAQGVKPWPSVDSYRQRGTSPWEIWYLGVANQTALSSVSATFGSLYAYEAVEPGGVLDRIAFEVATGVATAVGRAGFYARTGHPITYPATRYVDSGEFDCSSAGVKSSIVAVPVPAGTLWRVSHFGVATPTMRAMAAASFSHCHGLPSTLGANANLRLSVTQAYGALPATFVGGGTFSNGNATVVASRYAS